MKNNIIKHTINAILIIYSLACISLIIKNYLVYNYDLNFYIIPNVYYDLSTNINLLYYPIYLFLSVITFFNYVIVFLLKFEIVVAFFVIFILLRIPVSIFSLYYMKKEIDTCKFNIYLLLFSIFNLALFPLSLYLYFMHKKIDN